MASKDNKSLNGKPIGASMVDVDYCSVGRDRAVNEDYVLVREGVGICVADGIGGAPLGEAMARIACHSAMQALEREESASSAVAAAQSRVLSFIADVESPGSGASLAVVSLGTSSLDVSWAGDIAFFATMQGEKGGRLVSSLDRSRFPSVPPLGRGNNWKVGCFSERLTNIDSFAVCTDGAWRTADAGTIAKLLAERNAARATAAKIVLGRQQYDDSTAVVLRIG